MRPGLKLIFDMTLLTVLSLLMCNSELMLYLLGQARGQGRIVAGRQTLNEFASANKISKSEKRNLQVIHKVREYAENNFGFRDTDNYKYIYDQQGKPVLWVLSAAHPYELTEYEWTFPLLGKLSYKGYFDLRKASFEFLRLRRLGYDVEIRSVSAWSTLGWFNDPLLSSNLLREHAQFVNLIFHELFHATFYKAGEVELNENLANFVADKATEHFFQNDSVLLQKYKREMSEQRIYRNFVLRQVLALQEFYSQIKYFENKEQLKRHKFLQIADSIQKLPITKKSRLLTRSKTLLNSGNAYFVSFKQYDSMQDSLEKVFNKNYTGDLKKMVQDLRSE
jgi:predicted aminopeptidase